MRRALDGGLAAGGGTEQLNCGCLRRLADGLGGGAPSATVACLVLTEVNLPTTRRRVARPLHGRVTAALAESATAERGCGWRRNEDRTTGCGIREMCLSPGGTTPSGRPALILHLHPTRYRCTGDASPSAPGACPPAISLLGPGQWRHSLLPGRNFGFGKPDPRYPAAYSRRVGQDGPAYPGLCSDPDSSHACSFRWFRITGHAVTARPAADAW
jgi:hypothetical protein